jgi:diguanylate cyclase (GGDEF)-like protein
MTDIVKQTEQLRLAALRNDKLLDTPREAPFDRMIRLAKSLLRVPVAQIYFIDKERRWLKSSEGLGQRQTPRRDAFCKEVVKYGALLIVADASTDPRFRHLPQVLAAPHLRSYAGLPLRTHGGLKIGALCVMDTKVRHLSAKDIAILQDIARLVMDELELRLVATTDSLTGALSRRAFLKAAAHDFDRARRNSRDLSCILLDLDYFKTINDSYGHAVGDLALQEVVLLLKANLRDEDYLGRIGGEEFAIVMPGAGRLAARAIGERLRRQVMDAVLEIPNGKLKLTASVGLATLMDVDAGIDDLLRRADDALYAAKAAGRNRLVCDERTALKLVAR